MKTVVPVNSGTYRYFDRGTSGQLVQNMYYEPIESDGGKVEGVLRPVEGYTSVIAPAITGPDKIRAMHYSSTGPDGVSVMYAIAGDMLIRINDDMSYIVVGNVSNSVNKCYFADNGINLVVVDGTTMYKCDLAAENSTVASTFTAVALPIDDDTSQQVTPKNVALINQRFIIDSGRNKIYYSEVSSTTFDVLSFYTAESSADYIESFAVASNRLFLFGPKSYEVWTVDGTGDDPMSPILGVSSGIGVMAPYSVSSIADTVIFLGSSDAGRFTVFSINGVSAPKRISDNALEEWIEGLTQPASGEAWTYMSRGHFFYVLNFPADNITFCYDLTVGKWHTRMNQHPQTGRAIVYQPCVGVTGYNGKLYVGGASVAEIYEMSPLIHSFDGYPILWKWITSVFWSDLDRITLRKIQLDISVGLTDENDPDNYDYEPSVMARFSNDGGNSWSDETWQSVGRQGEYDLDPPTWMNPCGIGRSLVAMFSGSFRSKFSIRCIKLDIVKGR